jgi:hypothetical protein
VCDEKNITSGLAENLLVNVQMDVQVGKVKHQRSI